MKVVLTQDVKRTGRAYDIVDVADGFGLNMLIPKRLAIPATPANLRAAELRRKALAEQRRLDTELVKERLAALAESPITITRKVNEQGHLYDGVNAAEIAAAAQIPAECISIEKSFKEVGTYDIPVSEGDAFGSFKLTIKGEE